MIAEKLQILFDIDKIRDYYLNHVKNLEPIWQGSDFGGWSLLSSNGDYRDGWVRAYFTKDPDSGKTVFDKERADRDGFIPATLQVNFTQVCTGYMVEVMNQIRRLHFHPYRARWSMVMPGGKTGWHRDAAADTYAVRLHIPVITNEDCVFTTDEGSYHMTADGSCYLVAVNQMHMAVNAGSEERVHIIMDVNDVRGNSLHHSIRQHYEGLKNAPKLD